jgi:hypothetical protein
VVGLEAAGGNDEGAGADRFGRAVFAPGGEDDTVCAFRLTPALSWKKRGCVG